MFPLDKIDSIVYCAEGYSIVPNNILLSTSHFPPVGIFGIISASGNSIQITNVLVTCGSYTGGIGDSPATPKSTGSVQGTYTVDTLTIV